MQKANWLRRIPAALAGVTLFVGGAALAAQAQAPSAKPTGCSNYRLDEKKNRIVFPDPTITVLMPDKEEREGLRAQGTPGQIFVMKKNCETPDLEADVAVFAEPGKASNPPAETVPCAVRVVILEDQGGWLKVKGHTKLWKGTGWVHLTDTVMVVKY